MLTLAQVENYVKSFSRRHGVIDDEELYSIALYYLAVALDKEKVVKPANPGGYEMSWIAGCCRNFRMNLKKTQELHPSMLITKPDNVKEIIEELRLNQKQQRVLELRLEGYSDAEIGEMFNQTRRNICLIRAQIQEKYECLKTE